MGEFVSVRASFCLEVLEEAEGEGGGGGEEEDGLLVLSVLREMS